MTLIKWETKHERMERIEKEREAMETEATNKERLIGTTELLSYMVNRDIIQGNKLEATVIFREPTESEKVQGNISAHVIAKISGNVNREFAFNQVIKCSLSDNEQLKIQAALVVDEFCAVTAPTLIIVCYGKYLNNLPYFPNIARRLRSLKEYTVDAMQPHVM